jgi:hypothetical protein
VWALGSIAAICKLPMQTLAPSTAGPTGRRYRVLVAVKL